MPLIRFSTALTSFTRSTASATSRQPITTRNLSSTPFRAFAQGYGDGEGNPMSENPQDQGSSNDIKHNAEHPGPEPPAEGQGTGAGPTKGGSGSKSPEEKASAQSGGARSKEAEETGSSPTGGSVGGSGGKNNPKERNVDGASPKIHDAKEPGPNDESKKAEVEKHNREFEAGHDRVGQSTDQKVDKDFWKA